MQQGRACLFALQGAAVRQASRATSPGCSTAPRSGNVYTACGWEKTSPSHTMQTSTKSSRVRRAICVCLALQLHLHCQAQHNWRAIRVAPCPLFFLAFY